MCVQWEEYKEWANEIEPARVEEHIWTYKAIVNSMGWKHVMVDEI